ncbi:pheromone-processing carboxypeptidase KEX1 [Artemisia annua]|uniref:Pheromone-processing carboxypeptidase KEX1 n=1 Tax=Artemisia annua TaxID=35608 RepID=A0A2U1LWS4_ARTAN|nr:pheromone-processing carboxypeptidase KEX1 [Artemisia annua]
MLLMFWALSFLVVAIYLRGSSKRSSDNEACQYHCISCLSDIYVYPSSYKVDKGILDDTYSLTNITVVEDEHEFIPRVVHLELIDGASESHEDCKDLIPSCLHVKLIEGAIGNDDECEEFHGYDGYDEDNDDDGDQDDVDSEDDLNFRIEEFIAKNVSLWKEEMLNDKLFYLEY